MVGLLLAVPGLHGVGDVVTDMTPGWVVVAVALEILSCLGYVVIFLGGLRPRADRRSARASR